MEGTQGQNEGQPRDHWYATGKRKTSVARVWLRPGTGRIMVNHMPMEEYFDRVTARMIVLQPLELTNSREQVDISVTVQGGGKSGQADAVKHGISRGLVTMNAEHRPLLKRVGFLTRDARKKERKKYGQRGARARYQYSKR